MADAYFDSVAYSNTVKTAYDVANDWQLRSKAQFRDFIDKRPVAQAMPGSSVVFTISKDLAALATTPLTETVTPDSVAPQNPGQVTVTLNEYGLWMKHTTYLDTVSFIHVDMDKARQIANNQADTLDGLIRAVADGSSKFVSRIGGANVTTGANSGITATDTIKASTVGTAVTLLRRDLASPFWGDYFAAVIHPDVAFDLRTESGTSGQWLQPKQYVDPEGIYRGETGAFMGARFVENPRCTTTLDGASSAKVYKTYFFGHQALVEAVGVEPGVVVGNITDPLKRFIPLGWYGLAGWNIYRPEALRVVKTQASLSTLS